MDETVSGRAVKSLRLWNHNVDVWQQWLNGRLVWPYGEPGAWYVPHGVPDEYCEQVVNQGCRVRKGRREWFAMGNRDDHLRDCELLAAIAADIQGVRRLRPSVVKVGAPPAAADSWIKRRQEQVNRQRDPVDPFTPRGL